MFGYSSDTKMLEQLNDTLKKAIYYGRESSERNTKDLETSLNSLIKVIPSSWAMELNWDDFFPTIRMKK